MDAWTSGLFFGAMVDEELEEDLDEADEELEEDLDEEHETDEDETSACAPYLAHQMSCLGSRIPGVKDTPFLGSVWGAKEAGKRLPSGERRLSSRSTYKHAPQRHKEFTQVQAARRLKSLLLHVWIECFIMV